MEKLIDKLQHIHPNIPINTVHLEDGYNLNGLWLAYGTDGVRELINNYEKQGLTTSNQLEFINGHKIRYKGKAATYFVIGQLPSDMANMRVSLQVMDNQSERKHRIKIDLFDSVHLSNQCAELSEKYHYDMSLMELDLIALTDLLEKHREELYEAEINPVTKKYAEKELSPRAAEKAVQFLSSPKLMKNIDSLLEQSGIVGEEKGRLSLYVIGSSYKSVSTLHGMVQATSGAGKSHLINAVAQCMPQEDILDMTRITPKSLYHYGEKELTNKLVVIQDFDGLDEQAQFALREMQSNGKLSSSTVVKDMYGNTRSRLKLVNAHFSSMMATTKSEIYMDNASRSIIQGIDESMEQTQRIIERQNQKRAGKIDAEGEQEAKQLLRNCMRVLKKYHVVNPYADKLQLPVDAKMLRRLNEQYQDFITQITLLHQYQRHTDSKGRLIATKEDIKMATDIFFNAIILKIDELDDSTRQFFESLKAYVSKQPTGTTYRFSEREIRQFTNKGKTTVNKYIRLLQELEYIQRVEGSDNKGYKYLISYWDNMEKLKTRIRQEMNQQMEKL